MSVQRGEVPPAGPAFSLWPPARAWAQLRSALAGTDSRRRLVANSGWLISDRVVRALMGLAVGAWVARYLGPSQFGLMAYVVAFVGLFQAIANLGADAIVIRDIARHREAAPDILGTVLALRFASGFLCWAVCIGVVAAFNPDAPSTWVLAAIVGATLVFQSGDTVDLWFQSQTQSRRTVIAKLVAYGLSSALKVALILVHAPLLAFAVVAAFDAAVCALALYVAYLRFPTARRWQLVRGRVKPLLVESWPMVVSGLSIMVYIRIDQIMIKQMLGDDALGIYAAALPLYQFWQMLPLTLASSLAPFVSRLKMESEASYRSLLVVVFRAFFYLGIGTMLLTWLVSDSLVRLLFGTAYAEAARVLDILIIANVFCFLGIAYGLWLINECRLRVFLWGTLLAGIAAVSVNWLLLPRIGVVGAAWAMIAAQVIATFLINLVLDPRGFRMQLEAIFFRRHR